MAMAKTANTEQKATAATPPSTHPLPSSSSSSSSSPTTSATLASSSSSSSTTLPKIPTAATNVQEEGLELKRILFDVSAAQIISDYLETEDDEETDVLTRHHLNSRALANIVINSDWSNTGKAIGILTDPKAYGKLNAKDLTRIAIARLPAIEFIFSNPNLLNKLGEEHIKVIAFAHPTAPLIILNIILREPSATISPCIMEIASSNWEACYFLKNRPDLLSKFSLEQRSLLENTSNFSPSVDNLPARYRSITRQFIDDKEYECALLYCEISLRMKPEDAIMLNERGIILERLERFEKAEASYSEALSRKPDDHVIFVNRGFLLMKLKKYSKALEDFEAALRLRPDDARALYFKSQVEKILANTLKTTDNAEDKSKYATVSQANWWEALKTKYEKEKDTADHDDRNKIKSEIINQIIPNLACNATAIASAGLSFRTALEILVIYEKDFSSTTSASEFLKLKYELETEIGATVFKDTETMSVGANNNTLSSSPPTGSRTPSGAAATAVAGITSIAAKVAATDTATHSATVAATTQSLAQLVSNSIAAITSTASNSSSTSSTSSLTTSVPTPSTTNSSPPTDPPRNG